MKRITSFAMVSLILLFVAFCNNSIVSASELNSAIAFVENRGQFNPDIKFAALTTGANFYFHGNEITYVLAKKANSSSLNKESLKVKARFLNADPRAQVSGENELSYRHNYFIGNDRSKWRSNVSCYQSILYRDIYPGIDLRYIADDKGLKYEFIVQPGIDPSQIIIEYEGISELSIGETGELLISTAFGNLIEKAPYVYQVINGEYIEVSSNYHLLDNSSFTIAVSENYRTAHQLIIDPYVQWSSYLGGINREYCNDVTLDSDENIFIIGHSTSLDYPLSTPYQDTLAGLNIVITKLSSNGTNILYSTFLGGSGWDDGYVIKLDDDDNIYFGGKSSSPDFPTVNAYDSTYGDDHDVVVGKLSADGSELLFSTYLGDSGDEFAKDIAIDSSGKVYLTGSTKSENFPMVNAFDSTYGGNYVYDAFAAIFSNTGSELHYSTFIGSSYDDYGKAIEINEQGQIYIGGFTRSRYFPIYDAYDDSYNGMGDAFLIQFSENFGSLLFSSFFGGENGDDIDEIKIDNDGYVYIGGYTGSDEFPIVNAYQDDRRYSSNCAFLAKWNTTLDTLVYSTYFGTSSCIYDITFDSDNNIYLAGRTYSSIFPTVNPIDRTRNGGYDVFISTLNRVGDSLLFSTYFGGSDDESLPDIAVNSSNEIIVTGTTRSDDFPAYSPSLDTTFDGYSDMFIVKITNENGGTIRGVVTDIESNPIDSAIVNIESLATNAITNQDGEFVLPSLRDGVYNLFITHDDFLDTNYYDFPVALDDTTYVNLIMMTGGVIRGAITDSAANFIPNVYIKASGYPQYDSTGADGQYLLKGFASGYYDIYFRYAAGYQGFFDTVVSQVEVIGHDTTILDLSAIFEEAEIDIMFGNIDDSPVIAPIGQTIDIDVYFLANIEGVVGGHIMLPLGINNCYLDSFDTENCRMYYPFTDWDSKQFGNFNEDFNNDEGCTWDSYTYSAYAELFSPYTSPMLELNPGDPPLLGLTFPVTVSSEGSLHDSTVSDAIRLGHDPVMGGALIGNEEGTHNYFINQYFSPLHFVSFPYLPGDANMAAGIWPPTVIGGDVTYLVNYFKGAPSNTGCMQDGFFASADINGDCLVIGSDVTMLVNYFKGMNDLQYCPDYAPIWPTPDDLPEAAPIGWPYCDE
ncbi:MAG: hypothetical protein GY839_21815 [candidate division Zixibacteria bacterium]|nr:hypothetical protein [candidate division Zixibacteria bacterium]